MENWVTLYQDEPDQWHYHPPTQEMRLYEARKKLVYTGKELVVLDNKLGKGLGIPVSRWRLARIGLNCIVTAVAGRP